MLDLREVRSLTEFQRNAREHLERLRESGKPMVLTVNGRAEAVVQDADSYQELLDRLDRAETLAALRLALTEEAQGEAVPAREAIEALGRKHGLLR